MKHPHIIIDRKNHSYTNIGRLDGWENHQYLHPGLGDVVNGKLFIGKFLKTTGSEISFHTMQPGEEIPFLHTHETHEEVYIFLKGEGEFQVDGDCFPVEEGSVIRVATAGERSWRNSGKQPLTFIVIQAKENSLTVHETADGKGCNGTVQWTY